MSALPIGIDAERWITRVGCRNVLVAVHTVVAGQRLMDVVDLVESDPRVQLVYVQAPDVFGHGVGRFLRSVGALEIAWADARRERFDLALAAAYGGLDQLHAPIVVMPHGAAAPMCVMIGMRSPVRVCPTVEGWSLPYTPP